MRKRHLAGVALLLLQLGGSALADGPVIITQAKALAGNVTPGDKPGFPVSITASGSYRLGSDIKVAAGRNGIVVTTFDVTIDLDGFALDGGNVGEGRAANGIVATGSETGVLTIRNGAIIAFEESGIAAPTIKLTALDNLHVIADGGDGIRVGAYSRIANSTIVGNRGWGIVCGIRCSVQTSVIADNLKGGIKIKTGIVLGNTIESTTGGGINAIYGAAAGNNHISMSIGETPMRNVFPLQPNFCFPECQYAEPETTAKAP